MDLHGVYVIFIGYVTPRHLHILVSKVEPSYGRILQFISLLVLNKSLTPDAGLFQAEYTLSQTGDAVKKKNKKKNN